MRFSAKLALVVLFLPALLRGQPPHLPADSTKNFSNNGQFYELSAHGIHSFLQTLKKVNYGVYEKLEPRATSLEARESTAKIAMWGGLLGGIAISMVGALIDPLNPNLPLVFGGAAIAIGGPVTALILWPSRSDYLDFVNEHNRLNPKAPLDVALDFKLTPLPGGAWTGIRLSF